MPAPSPVSRAEIVFPEWKEEAVTHSLTKPGELVKAERGYAVVRFPTRASEAREYL